MIGFWPSNYYSSEKGQRYSCHTVYGTGPSSNTSYSSILSKTLSAIRWDSGMELSCNFTKRPFLHLHMNSFRYINHLLYIRPFLSISHLSPSEEPFNPTRQSYAHMRQFTKLQLIEIMADRLFGAKPSSQPMHTSGSFWPFWTNFNEISIIFIRCILKCRL